MLYISITFSLGRYTVDLIRCEEKLVVCIPLWQKKKTRNTKIILIMNPL